jgi:putative phosphoribosyl transferase
MRGFRDRRDAGRRLAARLGPLRRGGPVVLALPRGGVPVGYEVARALEAPLDVLIVRKLGCPGQPELGLGAIGEGGIRVLNEPLIATSGISSEALDRVIRKEEAELARRVRRYRGGRDAVPVDGRLVVLVDDGIATGFTVRAAIEVVRGAGAAQVCVAVPVAAAEVVHDLSSAADLVVCAEPQEWLASIGEWYDDFTQVSDDEVVELLTAATDPAGQR